jgi:uncharacterized membrane protein
LSCHVTVHAEIPAPQEAVFDFIADMRNDPRWAPMVKSVQQISGSGPGQGATYRIQQWLGPGKVKPMEIQVWIYDRPKRIEWRAEGRYMDYKSEMRFESVEGGTRITQESRVLMQRSRIPNWLHEFLTKRQLRKQFRLLRKLFDAYDFSGSTGRA